MTSSEKEKTALEAFNEAIAATGRVPSPAQEAYLKADFIIALEKDQPIPDLSKMKQAKHMKKLAEHLLLEWFVQEMRAKPEQAQEMIDVALKGRIGIKGFYRLITEGRTQPRIRSYLLRMALAYDPDVTLEVEKPEPVSLLTPNLKMQLPALYSQEHNRDPMVWAKFTNGRQDWYPTEFDHEGGDEFFGYIFECGEGELSYFCLSALEYPDTPYSEIEEIDLEGNSQVIFKMGLRMGQVWRDDTFQPKRLSEVKAELDQE